MLKSPLLFAIGVLVTLMQWTGIAKAEDINFGLSFELPPTGQVVSPSTHKPSPKIEIASSLPLSIESVATKEASLTYHQEELPSLLTENATVSVPAPPPSSLSSPGSKELANPAAAASNPPETTVDPTTVDPNDIALSFAENNLALDTEKTTPPVTSQLSDSDLFSDTLEKLNFDPNQEYPANDSTAELDVSNPALLFAESRLGSASVGKSDTASTYQTLALDDWIFEEGTHSLVARTVGSAEGTRHWDGRRTRAYYGHVDPGNGVWNLGTFSYQHSARTPEEADEKQLKRLKRQGLELESQAAKIGLKLSLEEKLNGLDLANQAPLAALDRGGYIERLAQAHRLQMQGDEAILWARTHAYIDPDTRRWNAPGLGNNVNSISRDQERRMTAISKALIAFDPNSINSASLNKLSNISLASANAEASGTQNGLPVIKAEPVSAGAFPDMEVSFGLPPTRPNLLDKLTTQIAAEDDSVKVAVSATNDTSEADSPSVATDTNTTNLAIAIEPTPDQVGSQQGSSASSNEIAAGATTPEAILTEETTVHPENRQAEIAPASELTDSIESSDPGESADSTSAAPLTVSRGENELFPLRRPEASVNTDHSDDKTASSPVEEDSKPDSLEATLSALTSDLAESSSDKLQRLLAGIGADSQPLEKLRTETEAVERATPEPAESHAAPKSQRSLWRIEDKADEF